METIELHLQPDSPFRLPDWRWQLSGYVVQQRYTPSPERLSDNYFHLCCTLRRGKERENQVRGSRCYNTNYNGKLRSITLALGFYNDDSLLKTELEARLLANEDYKSIARKLGTTPKVITTYERCFFNVADRLDSPSYITHRVIGKEIHFGATSRTFQAIWRLYGYWAGPAVVDALAHAYSQDVRPTTQDGVDSLFRADFDRQLTMKAAMYLRGIGYDGESLEKVSQLYLRLAAMRESQGGASAQEAAFLQHVQLLLDGLSLRRAQAGRIEQDSPTVVLDQGAGTLRAAELATVGALGHVPEHLQHMVEELSFPDIESEPEE